jgi:DNA-directed RNA polymerase II subunit RPB2
MALTGNDARELSRKLIDRYFRTNAYPYTRHHIDSYGQFVQQDMTSIIRSQNPVLILKELNEKTGEYKYRVEIFIGGENGNAIEIGTPTISLQDTNEVRVLYPNEARLRNLTYCSTVYADITVKITYTNDANVVSELPVEPFLKWPLFKLPIMLHSRYCILHNKPKEFLREAGECPYDNGGYFIVDGAEKVLITRQEQAFNTLYITPQNDPKVAVFASISCLSAETRQVKRVAFALMRHVEKEGFTSHATIQVSLPFVRKPVPLFLLFRALGFQSDEEIIKMIFPDFESPEAKLLLNKLHPCIIDSFPFMNTYTAIQYIKTLTKGFSEAHVLDIIRNQLFIHMPNDTHSQALYLGDCVRKILRVSEGYDSKTDRDDTRNQRCLTSGFLVQELFNNSYKLWIKAFVLEIGKEYNYNPNLYKDENFKNIFQPGNDTRIFKGGLLNDMIMKGFKGKWGTGLGEEKSGVLQAMSRLSYVDFMSHCRRVILDFDTGMKLTGPRKLHTSQYGYFCTSETPTGASIGITKNLTIMAAISTSSKTEKLFQWLRTTGRVYSPEDMTVEQRIVFVPVYVNGGMFGYTAKPDLLTHVLQLLKRSGCLPYSVSISFSIRDRKVYVYMDAGRPMRPLIWLIRAELPIRKLTEFKTWKELVMGTLRSDVTLESSEFHDPQEGLELEKYPAFLAPHTGAIEYIDPYEQNECFIVNNPTYITPEATHMEVHPSTIMSMMTSLIPFAPHNQSPRNQLSCSQSKQGLSIYATNWRNRFDNTAHVLCYGEMPMTRTLYNHYLGEGRMAYGMNCILAIACWSGYNQEDGIVMNYDAVHRGMFRSMAFRSYEAFEEDDEQAGIQVRFGNPKLIGNWKELRPGVDYSKLDDRGIIKEGEYVDETTAIVGAYMMSTTGGQMKDASKTPQVWTRGRVERVAVMVNNKGHRLVKIRVVQDRIPELGDKFSNRHGQKGTIGALLRGHDMPRTISGIVPDMIMNPHAIPSRMTIAQNLEQLMGKTAALSGTIGDGTSFMNDGSPQESIGGILEEIGFEKYGNEVMYNGATGEQIPATIFIGPVYGMRLKHMVEDKWQARGQGRKETRTHQPTGGRGAQGGLKIGEMDRDAIIAHAGMSFVKESFMERSDGAKMPMCVACGMIPIYNPKLNISICPMCDGPVRYSGDTVHNLEILPPLGRPKSKIVQVEMPFSTKLLTQEQETYLNLSMRYITSSGIQRLTPLESSGTASQVAIELPRFILPPTTAPAYIQPAEQPKFTLEELNSMEASMAEQLNPKLDVIAEEDAAMLEMEEPEQIIQVAMPQANMPQGMVQGMQQGIQQPFVNMQPSFGNGLEQQQMMQPQNEVVYPSQIAMPQNVMPPQTTMPQMGGNPLSFEYTIPQQQPYMGSAGFSNQQQVFPRISAGGDGVIANPLPGQGGAMLVVDTSGGAMAQLGLDQGGGSRRIRRYSRGPSMGGESMGGESMAPTFSSAMPTLPSGGAGTIRITKLE